MQRVQAGETVLLAILFERHHVPLFRYMLQLTRDRHRSEDIVQEAFLRVLKYGKTYRPELSFRVWLYQMARNIHIDAIRKQRPEVSTDKAEMIRSLEDAPDVSVAERQNQELLQVALTKLSAEKREVLVLSRFHELRYDQIAEIAHCEVGAVKVRVFRALKELRETFGRLQSRERVL